MCGITGIMSFNMVGQIHMIHLSAATKKLGHRGPDYQLTYNDPLIGVGHRRLSVIDPSPEANQPMWDATERYMIVYNGEVYNFKDLRNDLETDGFKFQSNSDTEVVLYSLVKWGKDAFKKFQGFFSLAFYDREKGELLLAIDAMGIKPLYWLLDNDKFLFSSELASLNQYGLDKSLDESSFRLFRELHYIPAPFSILSKVEKLKQGHYIRINRSTFEKESWKPKPKYQSNKSISFTDAKIEFKRLLKESISKRMVSDVPLGTFLSGGIDSSVISLEAKKIKDDLKTFSVSFDHQYLNEEAYSKEVAEHIGSDHHIISLGFNEFKSEVYDILDSLSEPFADSSAIAYYLLAKETRKQVTVALSGDGADELLGGYVKHLGFLESFKSGPRNLALQIAAPLLSILPSSRTGSKNKLRRAARFASLIGKNTGEKYWQLASFTNEKEAEKLLLKGSNERNYSAYQDFKKELFNSFEDSKEHLGMILSADQQLVLPGDMLTKSDRMSMAHGLEIRVPFLDTDLVEFINSLPEEFKIEGKLQKKILYEAYKDELPQSLYYRKKMGFEVPLAKWLPKIMSMDRIEPLFSSEYLKKQSIWSPEKVRFHLKKTKSSNPGDSPNTLWALLVFQWWYREFMDVDASLDS